ncbi:MAG: S41 family peptidase [Gammaproteobacteria bacterium]|nr:S41 family peptidase [Gammaproteobacteria bacterium]
MILTSRTLPLLAVGALLGGMFTLAISVTATADNQGETLPLQQMRTFTDIFTRIKKDYVEEVSDEELFEYAIRGMLSGLDPHSDYLNAEEFTKMQVDSTGQFGGLGIEVGMEDGFVKVVSPIDDTPAEKAGIKSGDLIIRLDDKPLKGLTLTDSVKLMRGAPGSEITLTIIREGEDKPLNITLERAIIKLTSIKDRLLDEKFAYVRISHFQTKSTADLIKSVKKLKKEAPGGLSGMVLDLRNNPGGVLSGAVGVSDAFLEEGMIVYIDGRDTDSKLRYDATAGDILDGAPLVVLVNSGSASASEIVAGAMQDHGRGIVMGSKTFGKGSVQTIEGLPTGGAVKLTTARYYTPNGRSIQAEGIEPDIVANPALITRQEDRGLQPLSEADLSGHLSSGQNEEKEKEAESASDSDQLAEQDYQLFEALNLLKGLAILSKKSS